MTENNLAISEPIFLAGAQRSGTTLLRIMLRHHPKIAWCNPFKHAVDQIPAYGDWPQLDQYYQRLEAEPKFLETGLTIDHSLNYPELVNSFLLQERERQGKQLVGATVHHYFDRALRIWPNARFIYVVRDGRDVARSGIALGWAGNFWTAVEPWIYAERLWKQNREMIPPEQRIEITYEELISEPIKTLTHLCNFIGVPYDRAMLTYPQTSTYGLPDPKLIGQWRRKLSDQEIQLAEARIADMLLERGYELSGLPILTVTPTMEKRLRLQDWWARVQFRMQRNGLPLFLADYLSRRLGFTQWQKQIQWKTHEIHKSYIK